MTRFLRWEPHKNAAETRQLLEAWATLYPNEDYYQWAIVEKATQVFGSISIYNSLLGEPQQKAAWPGLDLSEGIWEPGYCDTAKRVEQRLYHRSPPRGCRILVQKYK